MLSLTGTQKFFEDYWKIKDNLREIASSTIPPLAFDLGLSAKFSDYRSKAQKCLEAFGEMLTNVETSCFGVMLRDYKFNRAHSFDRFDKKPVISINYRQIRRFALKDIPRLMEDLEALD